MQSKATAFALVSASVRGIKVLARGGLVTAADVEAVLGAIAKWPTQLRKNVTKNGKDHNEGFCVGIVSRGVGRGWARH